MAGSCYVEALTRLGQSLGSLRVWLAVLEDPEFATAPGAGSHHHNYPGGLAEHTLEVARAAVAMAGDDSLLKQRAFVAAVFHDYGKIFEYARTSAGTYEKTPYWFHIGHVVGSYVFFLQAAKKARLTAEETEEIGHAILAHHGRYEWHSPVEPQTRLAYILHTADMLSAKGIK